MKKLITVLLLIGGYMISFAQVDEQASSSEIYEALLKLNNTATVMYVAAHPDDENTRLISWLSNHMHVNTVYLSLTRGDGGQNLIGTEKGPLLGLLRTQELLQARSIDGGKQFFSRANDFGYSKTATETREIWEEDEIMSDIVWAIRKHRPDILINRFDHNSNGKTHGHHTFSAVASLEAFDLAGNINEFPNQFPLVQPWQPKRVFFNTSWWFYGSHEKFEEADKSKMVDIDIGAYYPIRGISNNEIAAQSRSMHKCQGFGSAASRGSQMEYLEFLKGDAPAMDNGQMNDIFQGIDMTWKRVKDGAFIDEQLNKIISDFDFSQPSKSMPALLNLRHLIEPNASLANEDGPLRRRKINELNDIVRWCAALYMEATTSIATVTSGDSIELNIECINRANRDVMIKSIKLTSQATAFESGHTLEFNEGFKSNYKLALPNNVQITTPYWLEQKQKNIGMYVVENQKLIGLPETPQALSVEFEIKIDDHTFNFIEPIKYKYTDPAIGELYEPLVVAPPVAITFAEPIYVLANQKAASVKVEVRSQASNIKGRVKLDIGPGWKIEPAFYDFSITQQGDRENYTFEITPPDVEQIATMKASATVGNSTYNQSYTTVDYDHIPKQTVFLPAESIIEHLKITIPSLHIGYIAGAGDEIPASLRQLGIMVDEINMDNATLESLSQYQSIVVGIRAFNTQESLKYFSDDLWKYAEEGGTVIVQYNTAHRLKTDVSPLPMKLGRERITEEDAQLNILEKDHLVFNYPNKIVDTDFDGWVQERGLYFASEWDDVFTPLLSGHDTGEDEKKGMLLVAPYGKGHYVYTGLSFFRELPAGVPGAYRLFVNLLALQHEKP